MYKFVFACFYLLFFYSECIRHFTKTIFTNLENLKSSVLVINFLRHFTGENLFFYVHKPVYISTPLAEYKKYQGKFHIIKYSIFIFQGVVREEKWCLN